MHAPVRQYLNPSTPCDPSRNLRWRNCVPTKRVRVSENREMHRRSMRARAGFSHAQTTFVELTWPTLIANASICKGCGNEKDNCELPIPSCRKKTKVSNISALTSHCVTRHASKTATQPVPWCYYPSNQPLCLP
jgi:hypothetical protein